MRQQFLGCQAVNWHMSTSIPNIFSTHIMCLAALQKTGGSGDSALIAAPLPNNIAGCKFSVCFFYPAECLLQDCASALLFWFKRCIVNA
jgi:hypothetical protein